MKKDEFMPVLGIAVMIAFLFMVLKSHGAGLQAQQEQKNNNNLS